MNLSSQNYKSCQIFRHVVNVQRSNSLFYTDTTASFLGHMMRLITTLRFFLPFVQPA